MIPVLYETNTMEFVTNGIGKLASAISCTVTEERNGSYELEMTYPITGVLYVELQLSRIIWAVPADGKSGQGFRIYKITRPIGGVVTVHAEHVSYQLASIPVSKFSAASAAAAMVGLKDYAAANCPFIFWTDVTTAGTFEVEEPAGIRAKLGGSEGSVLDVFGGEYEWDNYTVRLKARRGRDSGVTLKYGKNITDLKQEENITNTVTGIYPYWKKDDTYVELTQKVVLSDKAGNYPYPRITVVDCSSEFEEEPTQDELLKWAQKYVKKTGIGIPSVSIDVSFVALWQTEEYKNIAPLERVNLCDTVLIEYEKLGVSAKAKVIKTVYNVLLDRYDSVSIGDAKASLSGTIAAQQQSLESKPSVSFLQEAVNNATKWITGTNGGYVVLHKNGNDQPYEMLIMNTDDINTATEVWRWNKGGLGYSSNGYNGPYATAITQDGHIVADFITTGTMLANIIKGGILTLGGPQNGNGACKVVDASGNIIAEINLGGITAIKGKIGGWTIGQNDISNDTSAYKVYLGNGTNANKDFIVLELKKSDGSLMYPFWIRADGRIGINLVEQDPNTPAITMGNTDGGEMSMGGYGFKVDYGGDYAELYYNQKDSIARLTLGKSSGEKVRIDSDGMIQTRYGKKGSATPNVHINSAGTILECGSSSRRYKHNESTELEAIDPHKLYKLPVKTYKYNDDYLSEDDPRHGQTFIGFIAEDVQEIYEPAVDYDDQGQPESWNSRVIVPTLLKLVQEQNERLKELEEWKNEVISADNG